MTMLTSSRWSAYYDSDVGSYILEDMLNNKEYMSQSSSLIIEIAREVFARDGLFPGEVDRLVRYVEQELELV